jgi:hypothetical protein
MPCCKSVNAVRCTYSGDLKHQVIYQAATLSLNSTAIAINLNIPLRGVQWICQNWSTIGEVCRDRTYMGRPLSIGRDAVKVCMPYMPPVASLIVSLVHAGFDRTQP